MTSRLLPALLGALSLSAAFPTPASDPAPARAAAAVKPADARVTIPVGGMSCGGCVSTITGKLQQVPGVKSVAVDLEKRRAAVTYDAARVTAKALVDAIRDAGFEPGVPVIN